MKYGEITSDLITKDGKRYHIWQVSDMAGFYLAENVDKAAARELTDSIMAACNAFITEMETTDALMNEDGSTEVFDELQRQAQESLELKNSTRELEEKLPYLIRRSTGEKIVINRNIFKLGKDAAYVDYLVDNNPTISRSHADIIRKKDGFYVKDKGSLNHTFIDGRKLEPEKSVKLEPGSLLQLADEVFEFVEE